MDLDTIKTQLDKIRELKKNLEGEIESSKQISDLSKEIRQKINQIILLPEMTSSGLESVDYIWENLLLAEVLAENELKARQQAAIPTSALSAQTPAVQPQSQPQPRAKVNFHAPTPRRVDPVEEL